MLSLFCCGSSVNVVNNDVAVFPASMDVLLVINEHRNFLGFSRVTASSEKDLEPVSEGCLVLMECGR